MFLLLISFLTEHQGAILTELAGTTQELVAKENELAPLNAKDPAMKDQHASISKRVAQLKAKVAMLQTRLDTINLLIKVWQALFKATNELLPRS